MKHANIRFGRFAGINNVQQASRTGKADLQTATNVEIIDDGSIRRRDGYRKVYSGNVSYVMPLNEVMYFKEDTYIKRLNDDNTATTVASGLHYNARMTHIEVANNIYYTDNYSSGVISNGVARTWGLSIPSKPNVTETVGEMPDGRYQVVLAYQRNDGQESGTQESVYIDITTGGISISDIPISDDSTVDYVNVYISKPNGTVPYRAMQLSNGTRATIYRTDTSDTTVPLETQLLSPPYPAQIIGYYNGRLFMGDGAVVWFTEPMNYELVNLYKNFWLFEDPVTMIAGTTRGIWVSTTKEIYFIQFEDIFGQVQRTTKATYGAIKGTACKISSDELNLEGIPTNESWLFATPEGICAGLNDGQLVNLTDGKYEFPYADEGIGSIRNGGDSKYYTVGMYYKRFITMPVVTVTATATVT